jgi:beta-glucosidase
LKLSTGPHKVVLEQLATQFASASGMRVGIVPLSTIVENDALEIASQADAVVLAVGFNSASESEGGDRSFELPVGQQQLIDQVAALGKKTIVVITSGGSVDVSPWKDKVQAIVASWYAGEEGGNAVARLLFGESNPSGHLPISWEKKITDNPSFNSYYPDRARIRSSIVTASSWAIAVTNTLVSSHFFPFGFGLSYTTFSFTNLKSIPTGDGRFSVTFDVANTGRSCRSYRRSALCRRIKPDGTAPG